MFRRFSIVSDASCWLHCAIVVEETGQATINMLYRKNKYHGEATGIMTASDLDDLFMSLANADCRDKAAAVSSIRYRLKYCPP